MVVGALPSTAVILLTGLDEGLSSFGDFLLLLFNHVGLHGVVVVMFSHELCQLNLLLQHGSIWLVVFGGGGAGGTGVVGSRLLVLADVVLVLVIVVLFLVARVVDGEQPPHDGCAAKIVNSQITAPLVLVLEPCEALALARLLVAHQAHPHGFAVLGEDCDDIAFGKVEWKAANVDVGCVAVIGVPGSVWRDYFLELLFV